MGAANMPLRRTIVRRYARKRIFRQRLPETSWKMSQGVFCGGFRRPLCIGRFTARLAAMPRRGNAYPLVLRAALKGEIANAAVILVAQRISTIMDADQIVVLDEGRVAGIGTHKQLLESCAVYQQIARSQLSEDELA